MIPALGLRLGSSTAKSLFLGPYIYCVGAFLGTFIIKTTALAPLIQDFYLRNGANRGLRTLFNSNRNLAAALKEAVLAALSQADVLARGAPCQSQ